MTYPPSSSRTYVAQIIGFNHDTPADISGYGRDRAGITLQLGAANQNNSVWGTTLQMNSTNTNNTGWRNSLMRQTHMATMKNNMPQELIDVLCPVVKLSSAGNNVATINPDTDELFLLAESEVFTSIANSFAGEGTRYAFYAAENSRIRRNAAGTAQWWWLRSPWSGNTTVFCGVNTNGAASFGNADGSGSVSFGFCI
jgi:hypothetical protein